MNHEFRFGMSDGAALHRAERLLRNRISLRLILQILLIAALTIGVPLFVWARYFVGADDAPAKPIKEATWAPAALGVGALGWIEPRSRLIRVSNEAAATGGVVGEILVREGQSIKAGTRIAVLSDWRRRRAEVALAAAEISAAKARLLAAEAEFESAQRDAERKKSLYKSGSATLSVVDGVELRLKKAKADVDVATASIQQGEANLELKEAQLSQAVSTAPIDGVVIKINARPGERIGPNGVADIANLNELDVVAEVYETDIPRVRVGQKAIVKLPEVSAPYQAKVREIAFLVRKNRVNDTDPLADRDNKIVEVRLTLERPGIEQLRHQLFRQVQVQIEK
ncbi:HlyD family efflux transporter periplasmic adaptor subunit [Methylocystis sp. L43]|uniref:HlyD family efflux transporter periplasmic adaptor subunit n=1 Tax=unclassified Methylocystis TaxID=2625913 RepID=UPI0018C22C72|nr:MULTISPECIES: HlyD family efflux transporter periplasmic adaptor subunit [unclassified Methylocystis]MBG0798412.1 HlyD family efflux transporter periplasmic adaptor subunit [Methylocystis sp. L43]MBG0805886.1 HlyD family efflux transporter periplasmic adaptor subunit [Methylocystis sp. H15]